MALLNLVKTTWVKHFPGFLLYRMSQIHTQRLWEIRVKWANGAVNLIEPIAHSGANGAGEARMILDCVNSAANEHPNQTEIRIAMGGGGGGGATGAFNLITTIAKIKEKADST